MVASCRTLWGVHCIFHCVHVRHCSSWSHLQSYINHVALLHCFASSIRPCLPFSIADWARCLLVGWGCLTFAYIAAFPLMQMPSTTRSCGSTCLTVWVWFCVERQLLSVFSLCMVNGIAANNIDSVVPELQEHEHQRDWEKLLQPTKWRLRNYNRQQIL